MLFGVLVFEVILFLSSFWRDRVVVAVFLECPCEVPAHISVRTRGNRLLLGSADFNCSNYSKTLLCKGLVPQTKSLPLHFSVLPLQL
jgi:hypothetical protein